MLHLIMFPCQVRGEARTMVPSSLERHFSTKLALPLPSSLGFSKSLNLPEPDLLFPFCAKAGILP